MKHKTIAVIGLGRFGSTIAKMLASMNHEVLGVDIDPEVVQKISPFITHAIVADTTDEEAIKALALSQFDLVIVAIGGNLQANLMTAMLLKELEAPKIVAKAENNIQGKMLHSNLREKYNLNAVGIRRGEDLEVPPNPSTILDEDDKLLVIGNNSDLDALTM